MKKFFLLALALTLSLGAFGGCGKSGEYADATELVFFRARSNNMPDGTYDEEVTKAIEQKFYEDRGIKLKLTMNIYSGDDLPTQVDANYNRSKATMEAVGHYISEDGGSAILRYAKEPEATIDVEPLLKEHGTHVLEAIRKNDTDHLSERAGYVPVDGEYKMNIIPSVKQERSFAMLIRKDMMNAVKGKTGLDPERFDVLNDDYENMSFSDFERTLIAIKENVPGLTYSVTGAPWDMGRIVAPVFGVDYANSGIDEFGRFVPTQIMPEYGRYVDLMYRWAKNGIWEKDSANMTDDKRLNMFLSGQAACFISYPEITNLITVAKKFNLANKDPNAEIMVMAPLKDENGKVNGFIKESRAFEGLILPFKAKNPALTVQFLDWMYEDAANYELCKYGIKGEHWVDGEDLTVDGKTYKTWQYPDEKADEFSLKKPYSGKWEVLTNINVSNRINAAYNTNEKLWYISATEKFECFGSESTEGIWMEDVPFKFSHESDKLGEYVGNIRGKAWAGIEDSQGRTPLTMWEAYRTDVYSSCTEFLNYTNEQYGKSTTFFKDKFKD